MVRQNITDYEEEQLATEGKNANGYVIGKDQNGVKPDSYTSLEMEYNSQNVMPKENKGNEEDKNKVEEETSTVPFFQLFRYSNSKERILMMVGVVTSMLAGICMPAMIILFGDITNAFVFHATNKTELWLNSIDQLNVTYDEFEMILEAKYGSDNFFTSVIRFGAGTAIIAVIQMVMGYMFVASMNYAAEGQVFRLRGQFLRSILKQEIGWFDTHKTNDFASRVTEDLNKLQEGIGEKVGMFIFFLTTFIASLINAFVHGWELTLVILSVFPLLAISTGIIAKVQTNLTAIELKEYAKAGSIAEEVISSIRTVFSFSGESKEVQRYETNLIFAKKAGVKRGLLTGMGLGFMWFIIYAAYALAFWYGTKLILDSRPPSKGHYDPSTLLVVFFSVLMGAMNMGQAAPYVEAFNVARGAAFTIFGIIERSSAIDPTTTDGLMPQTVNGLIELKNVVFNYPSRSDVVILKGVSLRVSPGQTVALVGSSGCGKSTCIQLLQRFYDPISGSLYLDGKNIRDLNLGWLRDHIGVVGQEPVLFATTIEENIRYGREGVTLKEIQQAAEEANAHSFIMKLPKKYNTQVGERGAQLSGGQKQRIAIARALVRRPKILLLDEATSALDYQSELVVQQALDKVRQGRTTIIVAHRLSTIRSADLIVVFQMGQVMEVGTHEDLMVKKALYYSLVMAQVTPAELEIIKVKPVPIEEDDNVADTLMEVHQELVDELTNTSPLAFTRSPSLRQSVRKRRSSSVKSIGSKNEIKKEKAEKFKEVPISKILKWNSSEWHYITVGVIASAIQGTLMPLYAILFGNVLGTLSIAEEETARQEANKYSVMFLLIGIVAAISMFFQAYMFALAGEILTMRLRKMTFGAMLKQEMGWFDDDKNSVGALCSRLSGDASAVQGATGSRLGTIVQSLTTLSLSLALALYFDWRLGLVCFPFIPFVLMAVYIQSKILTGQSVTESKFLEEAGKIAIEAINNIRTVASLHKEQHFADMYAKALYTPHLDALKKSHIRGAAFGFAQCIPFFAYSVVMFYGGYLVDQGELEYDKVFKVGEALIFGTMMVGQAVAFAPNYNKAKVSASRIYALLERRPLIDSSAGVGLRLSGLVTAIEMRDVHFHYPTRPDIPILSGLNVRVDRGQTLALVGSSGCGKSTIIGLLERFYDAKSGSVCISGQDVQGLNIGYVRSQLGLVSQEPVLFDRTIMDNIAYGDNSRTVSIEEIKAAAMQANIHTFIQSLPDGYETNCGSKGTQLSGGQKQRIAIARALVRSPGVLLLDEATSALDTESEKVVQEALERAQTGRTSIVIAHRLSTIQGADTIAVVNKGQIVEAGTHAELVEKKGHYYELYQTNK